MIRAPRSTALLATALLATTALVSPGGGVRAAEPAATALPTGGKVVGTTAAPAGAVPVTIATDAARATMTVTQTVDRAAIEWDRFNVGRDATVRFVQPSAASATLNRVTGKDDPSRILGRIEATGQVWLVNPSGVYFGAGARVDVSGLLATTHDVSTADFLKGAGADGVRRLVLEAGAGPLGTVETDAGAEISVRDAGLAALVAPHVANRGVIAAGLGSVVLASGRVATVDLKGNRLINFAISGAVTERPVGRDGKPVDELVTNSGAIFADGGRVLLTANAAKGIVDRAIGMPGVIQARSVRQLADGTVELLGEGAGAVEVSGTIDARGVEAGTKGGTVVVTGEYAGLRKGAVIDASGVAGGGEVLVGGDYLGGTASAERMAELKIRPARKPVRNATATYLDVDSVIRADATAAGDGGKVIAWADHTTRAHGTISARGGPQGGDGGFVETSGKAYLDVEGAKVDVRGARVGTWLLDPADMYILTDSEFDASNGTVAAANGSVYDTVGTFSKLKASVLSAALNTANVTVQTTGGSGSSGDIFVQAPITKTASGTTTLTLIADRDIVVTAGITNFLGNLNVDLSAARDIIVTASITTNGGDLTLRARKDDGPEGRIEIRNAQLMSAGGRIDIGGNIYEAGQARFARSYQTTGDIAGVYVADSTIDAGGGNIRIFGDYAGNGAVDSGNGTKSGVRFKDTVVRTDGGGTITVIGSYSGTVAGAATGIDHDAGTTVFLAHAGDILLTGRANTATQVAQGANAHVHLATTGGGWIYIEATGPGFDDTGDDEAEYNGTAEGAIALGPAPTASSLNIGHLPTGFTLAAGLTAGAGGVILTADVIRFVAAGRPSGSDDNGTLRINGDADATLSIRTNRSDRPIRIGATRPSNTLYLSPEWFSATGGVLTGFDALNIGTDARTTSVTIDGTIAGDRSITVSSKGRIRLENDGELSATASRSIWLQTSGSDGIDMQNGSRISVVDGDVTLIADNVFLFGDPGGDSIQATGTNDGGSRMLSLRPSTTTRNIAVGYGTSPEGTLGINQQELNQFEGFRTVRIGDDVGTGNVDVTGTRTIDAGVDFVIGNGGGGSVLTLLGALNITRAGNDPGRTVLIGRTIGAQNGALLSVGDGGLTLRADALTFAAGAQILVSSGATSAAVFLRALDDATDIYVGATSVPAGNAVFDTADIAALSAFGSLRIGAAGNGTDFRIGTVRAWGAGLQNRLASGRNVTLATGGFPGSDPLDGAIFLNGGMNVANAAGLFRIEAAGFVNVGGAAIGGPTVNDGAYSLGVGTTIVGKGVTIAAPVTMTGGNPLSLTATGSGSGGITLNAPITMGTGTLSLAAATGGFVTFGSTIASSGGDVTVDGAGTTVTLQAVATITGVGGVLRIGTAEAQTVADGDFAALAESGFSSVTVNGAPVSAVPPTDDLILTGVQSGTFVNDWRVFGDATRPLVLGTKFSATFGGVGNGLLFQGTAITVGGTATIAGGTGTVVFQISTGLSVNPGATLTGKLARVQTPTSVNAQPIVIGGGEATGTVYLSPTLVRELGQVGAKARFQQVAVGPAAGVSGGSVTVAEALSVNRPLELGGSSLTIAAPVTTNGNWLYVHADTLDVGATVTLGNAAVIVGPQFSGTPVNLGDGGWTEDGGLYLGSAEIARFTGVRFLALGGSNTFLLEEAGGPDDIFSPQAGLVTVGTFTAATDVNVIGDDVTVTGAVTLTGATSDLYLNAFSGNGTIATTATGRITLAGGQIWIQSAAVDLGGAVGSIAGASGVEFIGFNPEDQNDRAIGVGSGERLYQVDADELRTIAGGVGIGINADDIRLDGDLDLGGWAGSLRFGLVGEISTTNVVTLGSSLVYSRSAGANNQFIGRRIVVEAGAQVAANSGTDGSVHFRTLDLDIKAAPSWIVSDAPRIRSLSDDGDILLQSASVEGTLVLTNAEIESFKGSARLSIGGTSGAAGGTVTVAESMTFSFPVAINPRNANARVVVREGVVLRSEAPDVDPGLELQFQHGEGGFLDIEPGARIEAIGDMGFRGRDMRFRTAAGNLSGDRLNFLPIVDGASGAEGSIGVGTVADPSRFGYVVTQAMADMATGFSGFSIGSTFGSGRVILGDVAFAKNTDVLMLEAGGRVEAQGTVTAAGSLTLRGREVTVGAGATVIANNGFSLNATTGRAMIAGTIRVTGWSSIRAAGLLDLSGTVTALTDDLSIRSSERILLSGDVRNEATVYRRTFLSAPTVVQAPTGRVTMTGDVPDLYVFADRLELNGTTGSLNASQGSSIDWFFLNPFATSGTAPLRVVVAPGSEGVLSGFERTWIGGGALVPTQIGTSDAVSRLVPVIIDGDLTLTADARIFGTAITLNGAVTVTASDSSDPVLTVATTGTFALGPAGRLRIARARAPGDETDISLVAATLALGSTDGVVSVTGTGSGTSRAAFAASAGTDDVPFAVAGGFSSVTLNGNPITVGRTRGAPQGGDDQPTTTAVVQRASDQAARVAFTAAITTELETASRASVVVPVAPTASLPASTATATPLVPTPQPAAVAQIPVEITTAAFQQGAAQVQQVLATSGSLAAAMSTMNTQLGFTNVQQRAVLDTLPATQIVTALAASNTPAAQAVAAVAPAILQGRVGFAEVRERLVAAGADPVEARSYLNVFQRLQKEARTEQFSAALDQLRADPEAGSVFGRRSDAPLEIARAEVALSPLGAGVARVEGQLNEGSRFVTMQVNGRWVFVDDQGRYAADVRPLDGTNVMVLSVTDERGQRVDRSLTVDLPPAQRSDAEGPFRRPLRLTQAEADRLDARALADSLAQAPASGAPRPGRRIALMFALQTYEDEGVPDLGTPHADADLVSRALAERLGFETRVVKDATRERMLDAIRMLGRELIQEDTVVVYFAGHGYSFSGTDMAFWLPVDAEITRANAWISSADISRLLHRMPARQVLLVADSCYSGSFAADGVTGVTDDAMRAMTGRAVMAITAGGDEPVADGTVNSPFAEALTRQIQAITGPVQVSRLFETIQTEVSLETPQTPAYGIVRFAGYDEGSDFVLTPVGTPAPAAVGLAPDPAPRPHAAVRTGPAPILAALRPREAAE